MKRVLLLFALPVGAIMVTLLLLAGAGELALRIREEHRETVPGSEPTLYYRHGRLGHALVRGGSYYHWAHVNAQGFRGARPTARIAPTRYRVLALGASTTFDSFVSADASAWPAQVETSLRASGLDAEVLNAGTPGYVLLDNLIRWHTELAAYRPNLLILYHGHNEVLAALRTAQRAGKDGPPSARPGAVPTITPWVMWLEQHSLLYTKVLAGWKAAAWVRSGEQQQSRRAMTPAAWDTAITSAAAQYRRELVTFLEVAAVDSVPVLLVDMAHLQRVQGDTLAVQAWRATVPTAPVDVTLRAYAAFNAVTAQVAQARRLPMVPLSRLGPQDRDGYSPGDPIHFNDAGAREVALAVGIRTALLLRR